MLKSIMQYVLLIALCLGPVAAMAQGDTRVVRGDAAIGEDQLIATLQGSGDFAAKEEACRVLKRAGTAKCVPALAALLSDEKLSHLARFALEPMQLPEAGQALRDALGTTSGLQKMGVIISLGARDDAAATPLLIPLLQDQDLNVARAAAGALGRIATPEAVKALQEAKPADDHVKIAVAEGLLAAGLKLSANNKPADAAAIYDALIQSESPGYIKLGAYRGKVTAAPDQATSILLKGLGGQRPMARDFAAQLVVETTAGTQELADALPGLPAPGQIALLRGLGGRKDSIARPAVLAAIDSPDKSVKLAALSAIGQLGTAEDVAALVALLGTDDAEVAAGATAALAKLRGTEVNAAVASAMSAAAPAVKAQLLSALSERMAAETVPTALENLKSDNADVRVAALNALAQQGGAGEVAVVVAALKEATDNTIRGAAGKALAAISRIQKDAALPVVLEGMNGASVEARTAMLRTLDQVGTKAALDAVVAALGDSEAKISNEAAQVLSNWPSQEAAPQLLALAQNEASPHKQLGLRGYVRLAREEGDGGKKVQMLTTAMDAAKNPQEKFLVLGAWGSAPSKQALDVLAPLLDDATVQNEAAAAIIQVAEKLGKADATGKAQSIEALNAVLAKIQQQGIKDRAQATLTMLQK